MIGPLVQPFLKSAFSKIPESALVQVIFGPLIDLYEDYKKLVSLPQPEYRYFLHGLITILGIITGIIVPLLSEEFYSAISSFFLPLENNRFLTIYISAWIFSYPSGIIVKFISELTLITKYGDTQYYLTKSRLAELEELIGKPRADITSLFSYVRYSYRNGVETLHARAGRLEDVLKGFMYGGKLTVSQYFNYLIGFYESALLENGNLSIINDVPRMQTIAKRYNINSNELVEVLYFCVDNLRADHDAIGSRKEDYAQIISDILEGSLTGHLKFVVQQKFALEQREKIVLLYNKNMAFLNSLLALQRERSSPQHSPSLTSLRVAAEKPNVLATSAHTTTAPVYYASPRDVEETKTHSHQSHISPEEDTLSSNTQFGSKDSIGTFLVPDLENMATDLWQRKQASSEASMPAGKRLSDLELQELISDYDLQLSRANSTLKQIPPPLPANTILRIARTIDDMAPNPPQLPNFQLTKEFQEIAKQAGPIIFNQPTNETTRSRFSTADTIQALRGKGIKTPVLETLSQESTRNASAHFRDSPKTKPKQTSSPSSKV